MDRNLPILAVVLALLACCCCLIVVAIGAAGMAVYQIASVTEMAPVWTEVFAPSTPTPEPVIVRTPIPTPLPGSAETLESLENTLVPSRDLRTLAMRLKGIPDIPEVVTTNPPEYDEGDEAEFYASNTDTLENFTVRARLIYETENVYFFAEDGVRVDYDEVKALVDEFQDKTYPTNHEFFGTEWTPGVDSDPHLYILYAHNLGSTGYYSSADEYSRLAHEYSNEKEMFYINAGHVEPGDRYMAGVLAHEFQHMIHWYHDINEETWLNEGSAELAGFLNGFGPSDWDSSFASEPDLQLTAWTEDGSPGNEHYGAAFLFMTYFLDRFGNEATQALVADPANGMRSVDDVLAARGLADPLTGQALTADEVFADWVVANYLGDDAVADGRYAYANYPGAPTVYMPTESFYTCPVRAQASTVRQYAADYYEINCNGQITIDFTGSQQVRVAPAEPHSGRYAFWGNRVDESDTTLTREFDLGGLTSATLTYWAWWQIETDWDYLYVVVSADDGQTWRILQTPSSTDSDPNGNNFGWGYTGDSGGGGEAAWVQEKLDLSEYAGRKILVRFEYVTDAAVNRPGLLLDDVEVPELNYSADFESDDGGWAAEGFVRMDNLLPQGFAVQVIHHGRSGSQTTVERLPLDASNHGSLQLDVASGEKITLVVSGTARFTTEVASYEFEVSK